MSGDLVSTRIKTFEERVEERIERQIKLAEESNRLLMCHTIALERIASSLESIVKHNTWSRSNG